MANFKEIVPFTYEKEGGLSRASSDTARFNPSPYSIKDPKDGVVKTGWHTNKGVTYSTFRDGASKYGYVDNAENFAKMPEEIWTKIAKKGFWDTMNLDAMKSQAIANLFFSWMWGSGYSWRKRFQAYLTTKGVDWSISDLKKIPSIIDSLVAKEGEKKIFDELIEQKRQFLISLNQPANTKGWLNRLEALKNLSYGYIGKTTKVVSAEIENVKKNPFKTGILTALILVSGYILLTQTKIIKLKR
jgi:lysozyme family protein